MLPIMMVALISPALAEDDNDTTSADRLRVQGSAEVGADNVALIASRTYPEFARPTFEAEAAIGVRTGLRDHSPFSRLWAGAAYDTYHGTGLTVATGQSDGAIRVGLEWYNGQFGGDADTRSLLAAGRFHYPLLRGPKCTAGIGIGLSMGAEYNRSHVWATSTWGLGLAGGIPGD